ncbi:hypothetical protein V6N13_139628 [Hibiscus sabdariffa]
MRLMVQFKWSHLVSLDLSENQLVSLNLRHLNLAYNQFARQKLPRIRVLSSLEYLNLSKTGLIGHIPSKIPQLSCLQTLDVSSNHLNVRISSLIPKSLKILDVSNDGLSGEIPVCVSEKLPLKRYNFPYNNLTLCASRISLDNFETAFYGSLNSCLIAAVLIKTRASIYKVFTLTLP